MLDFQRRVENALCVSVNLIRLDSVPKVMFIIVAISGPVLFCFLLITARHFKLPLWLELTFFTVRALTSIWIKTFTVRTIVALPRLQSLALVFLELQLSLESLILHHLVLQLLLHLMVKITAKDKR